MPKLLSKSMHQDFKTPSISMDDVRQSLSIPFDSYVPDVMCASQHSSSTAQSRPMIYIPGGILFSAPSWPTLIESLACRNTMRFELWEPLSIPREISLQLLSSRLRLPWSRTPRHNPARLASNSSQLFTRKGRQNHDLKVMLLLQRQSPARMHSATLDAKEFSQPVDHMYVPIGCW